MQNKALEEYYEKGEDVPDDIAYAHIPESLRKRREFEQAQRMNQFETSFMCKNETRGVSRDDLV